MTRQEYLDKLRGALRSAMPETAAQSVLGDYYEFFEDGIADGKSEGELCREFGDPEKLAARLIREGGFRPVVNLPATPTTVLKWGAAILCAVAGWFSAWGPVSAPSSPLITIAGAALVLVILLIGAGKKGENPVIAVFSVLVFAAAVYVNSVGSAFLLMYAAILVTALFARTNPKLFKTLAFTPLLAVAGTALFSLHANPVNELWVISRAVELPFYIPVLLLTVRQAERPTSLWGGLLFFLIVLIHAFHNTHWAWQAPGLGLTPDYAAFIGTAAAGAVIGALISLTVYLAKRKGVTK